jgi:hypothetical protein
MKPMIGLLFAMFFALGPCAQVRGDDNEATVVLDRAIAALGGEAKLRHAGAVAWRARGKSVGDGSESAFTNQTTVQGLDHFRMEWTDEVDGNLVMGVTVVNGNKGWRRYDGETTDLDDARLANHKRNIYLLVVPVMLVPLKGNTFLIERAGDENVGGKPAAGLKVVGPDGKEFTLYFDKETGLPVKLVAKVLGFEGQQVTQEMTFGDYKEFDGIKKATRMERRRDGEKILEQEILEFKVLDKVAPETFAEPR